MTENLKFKSSLKQSLNNKSFKLKFFQKNTKLSFDKNCNNDFCLYYLFKILENLFQILKNNMQKNKLIFEQIKKFLYNKEFNNNNLRNNILPFDLKKEIFIDKLKTNKKKEEYYQKCKYTDNNNLRNRLFNKNLNYLSKTYSNNTILFNINSSRFSSNFNLRKINNENESMNIFLNNNDLNANYFMDRTTPLFYIKNNYMNNNNYILDEKITNNQNLSIYTKRAYIRNSKIKKEEKRIPSFSRYNNKYFLYGCEGFYTPYIVKDNKNFRPSTKITKNNKNINNIFLSDTLEGIQMEIYNPKKKNNLYSNFLINNSKINTERNIYKKNFSLTWRNKKPTSTINETNNIKFKEFEINFNNKSQLPFDSLKKNLKKEFINSKNNNFCVIKDNCQNEIEVNSKNKLNNKYITYNNIININDPKIIHKDIELIKNNNNNNSTPKIQTYLIYFKDKNKNLYKEDMIYHRPKSTSKFKGSSKIII